MATFLALAFSFPTIVFTTLLTVVLLYWVLVLAGAVGFDFGGDGAFEAKAGALEAKGGALEGAAEAKAGLMEALGFGVVPAGIVVTFLVFWAWCLSMAGSYFIGPVLGGMLPLWLGGSVVGVLALFVSTFVSAYSVKPLKPLFEIKSAPRRQQLLGKVAVISSGRVDDKFGQATMEDGGAGLIFNVFCAKPNELKKGDRVLLLEFDEKKDAYEIEPVEWLLPEEVQRLENPIAAEAIARAHLKQKVG